MSAADIARKLWADAEARRNRGIWEPVPADAMPTSDDPLPPTTSDDPWSAGIVSLSKEPF